MSSSEATQQQIKSIVTDDDVVLFMKGNRSFPQCGFSSTVVQILNGLIPEYKTVNVLADPAIRTGIKEFSSWPTIPQLYIKGEFVGGCDIIREMYAAGDLQKKLGVDTAADITPPTITVTPNAAEKIIEAMSDGPDDELVHLAIDAQFKAQLSFAKRGSAFVEVTSAGVTILVDPASCPRAEGVTIDWQDADKGPGFKIDNPNAPGEVVELAVVDLKTMLESGDVQLLDVRPANERALASIEGGRPLDDDTVAEISELDRNTPLAFYCHHGIRSRAAAEHFRDLGFTKVYNVKGGIAAWSSTIDPSVPTY